MAIALRWLSTSDTGNGQTYVGQTWGLDGERGRPLVGCRMATPGRSQRAGLWFSRDAHGRSRAELRRDRPLLDQCQPGGPSNPAAQFGIPAYVLIATAHAAGSGQCRARKAQKNRHAGWFTFVIADSLGNILNVEGSPSGIAVERIPEHYVRVSYGTRQMTGTPAGQSPQLHPRCRKMYELLTASASKNDLDRLQRYLADPKYEIGTVP